GEAARRGTGVRRRGFRPASKCALQRKRGDELDLARRQERRRARYRVRPREALALPVACGGDRVDHLAVAVERNGLRALAPRRKLGSRDADRLGEVRLGAELLDEEPYGFCGELDVRRHGGRSIAAIGVLLRAQRDTKLR